MAKSPKSSEICRNCGTELPVEEFARDPSKACGYKRLCKPCDNEKSKRGLRGEPRAEACRHGGAEGRVAGRQGVHGVAG